MGLREGVNIWIGTGAAAVISWIALGLGARSSLSAAFRAPSAVNVAAGFAVGIGMSLLTWWLYPLSVELFPPIQGEVETLYALLREPPGPIRAFPVLLLVVAAEELVWRGLAIDLFSKAWGPAGTVRRPCGAVHCASGLEPAGLRPVPRRVNDYGAGSAYFQTSLSTRR
jgi:membrane protease YdiL (CAAX protease family)